MKVLICGDRRWEDEGTIYRRITKLPLDTLIITGGARGADIIARIAAQNLGYPTKTIIAKWWKYGDAAGPIRNREMLDLKPDLVIAFHGDLKNSKGTKDCVNSARRRSIPVEVIEK